MAWIGASGSIAPPVPVRGDQVCPPSVERCRLPLLKPPRAIMTQLGFRESIRIRPGNLLGRGLVAPLSSMVVQVGLAAVPCDVLNTLPSLWATQMTSELATASALTCVGWAEWIADQVGGLPVLTSLVRQRE